jgi:hypothetical protein
VNLETRALLVKACRAMLREEKRASRTAAQRHNINEAYIAGYDEGSPRRWGRRAVYAASLRRRPRLGINRQRDAIRRARDRADNDQFAAGGGTSFTPRRRR